MVCVSYVRHTIQTFKCYLHCADNTADVVGDKLRKLRNNVNMLNVSFRQMYTPSQCLSVDESMAGKFRRYVYSF